MIRFIFTALPLLLSPIAARAGVGSITGKEPWLWTQEGICVLVGVIQNIENDNAPRSSAKIAVLRPAATIAGRFDPSEQAALPVRFYPGGANTSIGSVPPERALVIAVVQVSRDDKGHLKGFIRSDYVSFMPGSSALVVLSGPDDPRIAQTLARIQKARSGEGDPARGTSTRPSR